MGLSKSKNESIQPDSGSLAYEQFQNNTLRPIIKALHPIIINFFIAYLDQKKAQYYRLDEYDKPAYINKVFKTDIQLKYQLRGMVIGHFNEAELADYLGMRAEINKRINEIILKRIQDSANELL